MQDTGKKKKQSVKALNERYTQRFTLAKQGQQACASGDVKNAIKYYNMYLKIVADVKDVAEVDALSPQHFNLDKELSEILLISHIYWDLCKIFDLSPHLETEFQKTLSKFVQFTHGFKFQVVNAEMLRKFIRKNKHAHKKEFKEAYTQIFIASKKCYVATYCFGESHQVTETLRRFKTPLAQYRIGLVFIESYYRLSPHFVEFCSNHKVFSFFVTNLIMKPSLSFFSKFLNLLFKF